MVVVRPCDLRCHKFDQVLKVFLQSTACRFLGIFCSRPNWAACPQSDPSLYLIKDTVGLCFNLCRPNKLRLLIRKQIKSSKQSDDRPFKSHKFLLICTHSDKDKDNQDFSSHKSIIGWNNHCKLSMVWMWLWKHLPALISRALTHWSNKKIPHFLKIMNFINQPSRWWLSLVFHLRGSVKCSWSNNILCVKSGPFSISILVSCDNIWRTGFSLVNNIVRKEEISVGANAITVRRYYQRKKYVIVFKEIYLYVSTHLHISTNLGI